LPDAGAYFSANDSTNTSEISDKNPTGGPATPAQACGVEPPVNVKITVRDTIVADIDGDRIDEIISVGYLKADFWHDKIILTVIDEQELRQIQVDFGYIKSIYLEQTETGIPILFISYDARSADYVTTLYTIVNADPLLQQTVPGYVTSINDQHIMINDLISIFGIRDTYRMYTLNHDATIKATSDSIIINNEYSEPLVAARDLKAKLLINDQYTDSTLVSGTNIWPLATDNQTYMTFALDDGAEGTIFFTVEDSVKYIDGISENECFK
jgi:hypothetical protein